MGRAGQLSSKEEVRGKVGSGKVGDGKRQEGRYEVRAAVGGALVDDSVQRVVARAHVDGARAVRWDLLASECDVRKKSEMDCFPNCRRNSVHAAVTSSQGCPRTQHPCRSPEEFDRSYRHPRLCTRSPPQTCGQPSRPSDTATVQVSTLCATKICPNVGNRTWRRTGAARPETAVLGLVRKVVEKPAVVNAVET